MSNYGLVEIVRDGSGDCGGGLGPIRQVVFAPGDCKQKDAPISLLTQSARGLLGCPHVSAALPTSTKCCALSGELRDSRLQP